MTDARRSPAPAEPARRRFLASSALALAGLALGCSRRSVAAGAGVGAGTGEPGAGSNVTIAEFSNAGERLRTVQVAKVVKSDAEWRRQLSPLSYQVTRRGGTERAFSGPLLDEHRRGVFRCICCDTALFDAATKFESGTGWPSFWQPIAATNVTESRDFGLGVPRTAVSCARCDAHLGHVFADGPEPTGLRYCMDSAALRFAPAVTA